MVRCSRKLGQDVLIPYTGCFPLLYLCLTMCGRLLCQDTFMSAKVQLAGQACQEVEVPLSDGENKVRYNA